jgi:hypothetical protein
MVQIQMFPRELLETVDSFDSPSYPKGTCLICCWYCYGDIKISFFNRVISCLFDFGWNDHDGDDNDTALEIQS